MTFGAIGGAVLASVAGAVVTSAMSDGGGGGGGGSSASGGQERLANVQARIGEEQWDRWRSLYMPIEDEYVNEARNTGSIANQNQSAQQAAADVAAGFAGAREQLSEIPGINPNSDAYIRNANKINLAEAATSAAAQTGARESVRTRGRAAMTDAISLGKGLPATASTTLSAAGSGLSSAANFAAQQAANNQATAAAAGRTVGGLVGRGFDAWMNRPSTPTPVVGAAPGGAAPLEGGFGGTMADGRIYGSLEF